MSITSEAKQEVERLLRAGQKIQAVKYMHDMFQVSLADAKNLVEAVELEMKSSGMTPDPIPATLEEYSSSYSSLSPEAETIVTALLQSGKKIEAVKYVKVQLHTGLKEALGIVENVERKINPNAIPSSVGSGCAKGSLKIMVLIFGFVAFVLLFIAGLIYYFDQKIVENGERVDGVVVSLNYSGADTAPVIAYEWNGKKYRYKGTVYSNPTDYAVDEHVPIFVSNKNPEDVLIDRFSERWLAIIIIGSLAVFFGIFCFIMVFVSLRF